VSCVLAIGAATSTVEAGMTKGQCVKANAEGQTLQLDGNFAAARVQLERCGDPSCPAMVRDDCAQRLNELERAQPTIVFDVKDAAGGDVSQVSVSVDGRALAEKLDGRALRVDPGDHEFTFVVAGKPAVARRLVLKETEKGRRERVVLDAKGGLGSPGSDAGEGAEQGGLGTRRVLGLVVGGLGVAAVAVGSVLGVETFSAVSAQKSDCGSGPGCANRAQAQSDHSAAVTDATSSTVSFVAAGALLAGGAWLFFGTRSASPIAPSTGLRLMPAVAPGGGSLSVGGVF
jgi:hypothetical protein